MVYLGRQFPHSMVDIRFHAEYLPEKLEEYFADDPGNFGAVDAFVVDVESDNGTSGCQGDDEDGETVIQT